MNVSTLFWTIYKAVKQSYNDGFKGIVGYGYANEWKRLMDWATLVGNKDEYWQKAFGEKYWNFAKTWVNTHMPRIVSGGSLLFIKTENEALSIFGK